MGEHLIGRPIGPSYVPGTSQGNSSATAPGSQMTAPQPTTQPATSPAAAPPNPAQDPRNKFLPQGAALKGNIDPASALGNSIGRSNIAGVRRYSNG